MRNLEESEFKNKINNLLEEKLNILYSPEQQPDRHRAVECLGAWGDKKVLPYLKEALSHDNPFVRMSARDAIHRIREGYIIGRTINFLCKKIYTGPGSIASFVEWVESADYWTGRLTKKIRRNKYDAPAGALAF